MFKYNFLAAVALILATIGCTIQSPVSAKSTDMCCGAKLNVSPKVPARSASGTDKKAPKKILSGIASWYGMPFHGRKTASGQIYDMNKMTGAHLTLPLSSRVLVENPHNGKTVVIKVIDRGPYIKNRVIDLSREAARRLGILCSGIAYVNYSVLPAEAEVSSLPDTCPIKIVK